MKKIEHYYKNLDELYAISKNGQNKAQYFYDTEEHIKKRVELFEKIIKANK